MPPVSRLLPGAWSVVLAVLLLGPALGPGYVLSYDMVWVPDLALRPDALGTGSALPRAVPSDAVVAVLDEVVPGMLLQKAVLLGSLVGAGMGAAALVGGTVGARLVAVSVVQWNPFVVERLVIGHWPVLVGYAVLPWLFIASRRLRRTGRLAPWWPILVVVGSLSASSGLATGLVALLGGLRKGAAATNAVVLTVVLGANAPWLVAGLLHAPAATSDPAGAVLFATGDEGLLPGPLAALSLGGVWNLEVVPGSRTGWLGVAFLVMLLLLAGLGARRVHVGRDRAETLGLVAAWVVGVGLALLSWAAPGAVGWLAGNLPGGGLLRDGSRLLGLAAPLTAVAAAQGAVSLRDRLPDVASRALVVGVLAVLPVTLMPDAAFGASGRLQAVSLPASYDDVREAVAQAPPGDVVVLPFTSYRAPDWNGGRKVLDPLPRIVVRNAVTNDELSISGRVIPGEDPRAADVGEALAAGSGGARADRLRALGISVVVSSVVPGQRAPEVTGESAVEADAVAVTLLRGRVDVRAASLWWVAAMTLAWVAWAMTLVLAPALLGVATSSRWRNRVS